MKSTTCPLGKPGLLVNLSIRLPPTPPRAKPPRINQPFVRNLGPNQSRKRQAQDARRVKTQVCAPPREKAALSLKAKVKFRKLEITGTGLYNSRYCKAKSFVNWSIAITPIATLKKVRVALLKGCRVVN